MFKPVIISALLLAAVCIADTLKATVYSNCACTIVDTALTGPFPSPVDCVNVFGNYMKVVPTTTTFSYQTNCDVGCISGCGTSTTAAAGTTACVLVGVIGKYVKYTFTASGGAGAGTVAGLIYTDSLCTNMDMSISGSFVPRSNCIYAYNINNKVTPTSNGFTYEPNCNGNC